jgi:hypothetical protein
VRFACNDALVEGLCSVNVARGGKVEVNVDDGLTAQKLFHGRPYQPCHPMRYGRHCAVYCRFVRLVSKTAPWLNPPEVPEVPVCLAHQLRSRTCELY